jgi:hypothetical protein
MNTENEDRDGGIPVVGRSAGRWRPGFFSRDASDRAADQDVTEEQDSQENDNDDGQLLPVDGENPYSVPPNAPVSGVTSFPSQAYSDQAPGREGYSIEQGSGNNGVGAGLSREGASEVEKPDESMNPIPFGRSGRGWLGESADGADRASPEVSQTAVTAIDAGEEAQPDGSGTPQEISEESGSYLTPAASGVGAEAPATDVAASYSDWAAEAAGTVGSADNDERASESGVWLSTPEPGDSSIPVGGSNLPAGENSLHESLPGVPAELLTEIPRLAELAALVRQAVGFNFGRVTGVELTAVIDQMADHQQLDDDHLDLIRAVFVRPRGYEKVRADLAAPGSISVISGDTGSGRKTAAVHLLAELRRAGMSVRTLSYGIDSNFQARRMPRIDNCAFLLELPPDEDEFSVSTKFGRTLDEIAGILRSTSSRLVVLTDTDQWERVGGGASVIARELERPDAVNIARAWLRLDLSDGTARRWTDDHRIQPFLVGQSPSAAMEMLDLILQACSASFEDLSDVDSDVESTDEALRVTDDEEFNRRVLSVVSARKNWFSQLLKWHKKPQRTGFERNFLVVAAALRGAPIGHIYSQTGALAELIGGQKPELQGQDDIGVIQLVDSVDARLNGDYVEFSKPGWDEAVLDYFWRDRPLGREGFLKWMAKAPLRSTTQGVKEFNSDERALLAERMAFFTLRWAARHGTPENLSTIVTAWRKENTLEQAVVRLVTAAALHPVIGRDTHQVLYDWARKPNEDASLKAAVADVCAGEFGITYPGKALVRLRHVATSSDPDVIKAVNTAVQKLWEEDSVRSTLFSEVIKWCASTDESRQAAGRRGFVALAELAVDEQGAPLPALLAGQDSMGWTPARDDLSTGWRAALDPSVDEEQCRGALDLWLNAALEDAEIRETTVRVLRRAVQDEPGDTRQARPRHRLIDRMNIWQPPFPKTEEQRRREDLRREIEDAVHSDKARALDLLPQAQGMNSREGVEVERDDR